MWKGAIAAGTLLALGLGRADATVVGDAAARASRVLAWDRDRAACAGGSAGACVSEGARERELRASGLCRDERRDPRRSWLPCVGR